MSCQQRSGRVSSSAAVQNGIGAATSKAGNVIGTLAGTMGDSVTAATQTGQSASKTMAAAIRQKAGVAVGQWGKAQDAYNEKVLGRVAPVSNAILAKSDRATVTAAKAAPYIIGALTALRFRGYLVSQKGSAPVAALAVAPRPMKEVMQSRQTIGRAQRVVGTVGTVSALSASAAVWATKDKADERSLVLQEKGKVRAEVKFQSSAKLTGFLNKRDLIGSHRLGKNVLSSEGDIVQVAKGGLWHRGTSVVGTSNGQRTMTHLQSLKLPAQHYYFDRKLSDADVAGVVSGQQKAHRMPGYVGEVHATENLVPTWGATKKAMITTRLYHPSPQPQWSAPEKKKG